MEEELWKTKNTIEELLEFDYEAEWFEFKENISEPTKIGEYISAPF